MVLCASLRAVSAMQVSTSVVAHQPHPAHRAPTQAVVTVAAAPHKVVALEPPVPAPRPTPSPTPPPVPLPNPPLPPFPGPDPTGGPHPEEAPAPTRG